MKKLLNFLNVTLDFEKKSHLGCPGLYSFKSISEKLSNFLLMNNTDPDGRLTEGASTHVFEVPDAQEVFKTRFYERPGSGVLMFFLTPNVFWKK